MGFLFKSRTNRNRTLIENSNNKNNSFYKNYLVKATSLIKGSADSRESLSAPEYDLEEIRQASEADSYIKMSIMKYSYMLFKAGYLIKSDNEEASNYIKTRFYIMSFSTGKPIDILFQEIGDDLIKYSNAFLVKTRVKTIMPGIKAKGFFKSDPIGGYFRIDPSTITVQRDINGDIKKYIQIVEGKEKSYDKSDIIHFYLDKEAANAFGTPRMIAAMEDVKILRRIEGNVLTLIHRFSMPLFQWIIGKPITGFQATNAEIDEAKRQIDYMPLEGSVVTNEKTEIKAIGAQGSALNAEAYLNYFENRVFSALGVTQSQMGRGASKSSSSDMESQAHDTVKYIQKVFRIFVENNIINELLFEGGFNPVINKEDRVNLVFNEISLETKIKLENHKMNQYQSNMISFKEMRREIGEKEDVEENELYQFKIINTAEKNTINAQTEASIKISKAQSKLDNDDTNDNTDDKNTTDNNDNDDNQNTSNNKTSLKANNKSVGIKGVSPKGNGKIKSHKPNNAIKNLDNPTNQHGTTSVKIQEKQNFQNKLMKSKENDKKTFNNIYNKYNNLRNDIIEHPNDIDLLIPLTIKNIMEDIKLNMQIYSLEAINQATDDIEKIQHKKIILPVVKIRLNKFEEEANSTLNNIFKDIKKRIKNDISKENVENVFEVLEYRIRFLLNFVLPKVYWFSYLKTGEAFKYKKAYINSNNSDDAKKYNQVINISNFNIDSIPPFHSYCSCKITFKKGDK